MPRHVQTIPTPTTGAVMSNDDDSRRAVADRSYTLPELGNNPSSRKQGTTPGSFARPPRVGTAWSYSSPDTPGMPAPSELTAWDFLPPGWSRDPVCNFKTQASNSVTQLEHARC